MKYNYLKPNPYQLIALTKLLINEKRFLLITDGVGVGKTISAAYIASYFSKGGENPIVIVFLSGNTHKISGKLNKSNHKF